MYSFEGPRGFNLTLSYAIRRYLTATISAVVGTMTHRHYLTTTISPVVGTMTHQEHLDIYYIYSWNPHM